MLTEKQQRFVSKRKTMIRLWPWAGGSMLIIIIGFWLYLFIKQPLLVNPGCVINRINNGTIHGSTLTILAAFTPITLLTCGFLLIIFTLFLFAGMSNEKRFLEIIEYLQKKVE